MKALLRNLLSLASIGVFFLGAILYFFPTPCKDVLTYSIGTLDTKFGLSHEEFLTTIQKAEDAWEKPSGMNLFTYDPHSSFTINLIYDERQEKTDLAKEITSSLTQKSQTRDDIKKEYEALYATYKKAQATYTANIAAYEQDIRQLDAEIKASNDSGGASREKFEEFEERQRALKKRLSVLEQERLALNTLAAKVNNLADSENKVVKTYNAEVDKLKEEFGNEREFGQGEYTGKDITIYEFTNTKDLLLVLEHEMGHALGLSHLPQPSSVMYYLVHKGNVSLDGPTKDDLAALAAQCEKTSFTVFFERLQNVYTRLVSQQK